jgi:hypothetical protein
MFFTHLHLFIATKRLLEIQLLLNDFRCFNRVTPYGEMFHMNILWQPFYAKNETQENRFLTYILSRSSEASCGPVQTKLASRDTL